VIDQLKAGDDLALTVLREGTELAVKVRLAVLSVE
jgi:hypothetical protein